MQIIRSYVDWFVVGQSSQRYLMLQLMHVLLLMPQVCDFGFSVHLPLNQSHVSNTPRGTPFYVAPEVRPISYTRTCVAECTAQEKRRTRPQWHLGRR